MIENKQFRLKEQDDKFKVIIKNEMFDVQAPLPDGFGFTAGSEFSEPFDTGSMSESWQKVFAVTGISQKMGLRMRKMFTNPEPTEISVELEFVAFYDAKQEVLLPIIKLLLMTLGTRLTIGKVEEQARELIDRIVGAADNVGNLLGVDANATENADQAGDNYTDSGAQDNVNQVGGRLLELIKLVQSPEYISIRWGNVAFWEKCYITSVSHTFSNVLDPDGIPMSGKATVTITPEMYPIADDMIEVFSNGGINIR